MKRFTVVLLAFLTVPALAAEREVDLLSDDADASMYVFADDGDELDVDATTGLPDVSHLDLDGDEAFEFAPTPDTDTADADLLEDDEEVDLLAE